LLNWDDVLELFEATWKTFGIIHAVGLLDLEAGAGDRDYVTFPGPIQMHPYR
jgi:hypothetical protein